LRSLVALGLLLGAAQAAPPAGLRAGGGFSGLFPSATAGLRAPVSDAVDLEVRYDTVAGLAHDVGVTGRWHHAPYDLGLAVAHGFFGVEDLGGIPLQHAPLGEGLTTALVGGWTTHTARDHAVRVEVGLTARWWHVDDVDVGTQDRVFDPTVHHAHVEVGVDFVGGVFLRGRAVVPIQAELRVLGYLPVVMVGRAWTL
jgi:hypothetical protein